MFRRHFFLVGALAAVVLMVAAGGAKILLGGDKAGGGGPGGPGGPGGAGARAIPVAQVTATPRQFVDSLEVLGVAKGRQSVTLSAATTQLVDKVHIRDGQSVGRGAVLVELKATEQDAGLAQAQAQMIQAERTFRRWKQLGEQGWASQAAVDQYEAAYLSAKANVDAARARQGDRIIRAPFAGVVGLTDIAPGALINPGAPIVNLDDISMIRVDFSVPERFIASLREGQPITASLEAYPGEEISGRISKLDTRVDLATRAMTARAEFPNPGGRLKPGMMVRVAIARGERQGVAAPESALALEGDRAFVYVIVEQGGKTLAEQRAVRTGARSDGYVEIQEGLKPGERLVADGLNKLSPGQPVKVLPAGARRAQGDSARGAGAPSASASSGWPRA